MTAQDDHGAATLRRDDGALVFAGVLTRDAVAALWRQALPLLTGARHLDLAAVERVDSAGLALLAELAARIEGVTVVGLPDGLGDLRTAYRLDDALAFAR